MFFQEIEDGLFGKNKVFHSWIKIAEIMESNNNDSFKLSVLQ